MGLLFRLFVFGHMNEYCLPFFNALTISFIIFCVFINFSFLRSPSRHDFAIEVTDKAKPLQTLFVRPVPDIVVKSLQEAEKNTVRVDKIRSR